MSTPATCHSKTPARRSARTALIACGILFVLLGAMAVFAAKTPTLAPKIHFTTLTGQEFALSDLRGKVVVIHFWATTCAPCVHEMPALVKTYQAFRKNGVEWVAVAASYDPPSSVLDYAESRHLPFKVALDLDGLAAHRFGDVEFTPTTFVIDRSGHIVWRAVGELDFVRLREVINAQLAA